MKLVEGTAERLLFIADNLREQDAKEVMSSHGKDAKEACMESWVHSQLSRCFEGDDGNPVGIWGVNHLGDEQIIWMLGTNNLTATKSHRRQMHRLATTALKELVANGCDYLHNWCMAENKTSLHWLRHLGFTIDEPAPFGAENDMFCHFWRRD